MVSTGRGGAGNLRPETEATKTQEQNTEGLHPVQSYGANDGDKRIYYSTGRGGAGNIKKSKEIPSPKLVPQGSNTPKLHTNKVSTGRGGFGNMVDNNDPGLTRKLQDVDGPSNTSKENELQAVSSNKSFSVGRGGYGNVVSPKSVSPQLTDNNLYAILSHGTKVSDPKDKGLFGRIRSFFTGSK